MQGTHPPQLILVKAAGGLVWRGDEQPRQVAVLHRPRYNDWSLPKGKLKPGESWRQAAEREVVEETQSRVRIGGFVGCSTYLAVGVPKVVLYWHMDLLEERPFVPNLEVDGIEWLPSEQALRRLSHEPDRALVGCGYYIAHKAQWLSTFKSDGERWLAVLSRKLDSARADLIVSDARQAFLSMLPDLPYIGGEANHLTASLLTSARALALYEAMRERGYLPAQVGRVLYEAILSRGQQPAPAIPPGQRLGDQELMTRRRQRAEHSHLRPYEKDWFYDFVPGDGHSFDYGYDFYQCASQILYRERGAEEFLPYYCFLDYAESEIWGLGLERTMTLAEGHATCDHRFQKGRRTEPGWPPPFAGDDGSL